MYNYGEHLKMHRLNKHKTLQEVSKETGISVSSLHRWEREKSVPSVRHCIQLADYYNISFNALIGRKQTTFKNSASTEKSINEDKLK